MTHRAGWTERKRESEGTNHGAPRTTEKRLGLVWKKVEKTGFPQEFVSACERYGHAHVFEMDTDGSVGIVRKAPMLQNLEALDIETQEPEVIKPNKDEKEVREHPMVKFRRIIQGGVHRRFPSTP